jgi:hypothetical protein
MRMALAMHTRPREMITAIAFLQNTGLLGRNSKTLIRIPGGGMVATLYIRILSCA